MSKGYIEGKVKHTGSELQRTDDHHSRPVSRVNGTQGRIRQRNNPNTRSKDRSSHKQASAGKRVTYINKIGVEKEVNRAKNYYIEAKSVASSIMSGLRIGRAPDLNKTREVVNDCVDSILRNDDALLLLTKLEHKDENTAEHCLNVSIPSAAFGKKLGLLEKEIRTLGLCGLLHDIGKSKVPVDILQKPGALTAEEYGIMQNHFN